MNGKPLLAIYQPLRLPDPAAFNQLWQLMAKEAGLPGLHIIRWAQSQRRPFWKQDLMG